MLTFASRAAPRSDALTAPIALVAAIFWAFSYILFTSRVHLGADGAHAIFAERRFVTTAAGALLYAGVLRYVVFPAGRRPAHPLVLVAAVIPAAAAMVVFRVAIDPMVSPEPLPLARHLRWVLTWAGYFGLFLAGFVLWRMAAMRRDTPRQGAIAGLDPGLALERAIDALAEDFAALPPGDRDVLLQRLIAGYALADDPLGTQDRRQAIVHRISAASPDSYSSVRTSTVSPISANSTNGAHAASSGG